MDVFIVWERYCRCFDIISEESVSLLKVYASEDAAFFAVEELDAAPHDEDITYYYTREEVCE
jgi:hypothetical protein